MAVTAVVSSIISMLSPAKWSKYVGMITGLTVVVCIGQPVFSLLNEDLFMDMHLQTEQILMLSPSPPAPIAWAKMLWKF